MANAWPEIGDGAPMIGLTGGLCLNGAELLQQRFADHPYMLEGLQLQDTRAGRIKPKLHISCILFFSILPCEGRELWGAALLARRGSWGSGER